MFTRLKKFYLTLCFVITSLFTGHSVLAQSAPVLTAQPGNNRVILSWVPETYNNLTFNIERKLESSSAWSRIANVNSSPYTDSGVVNGTTYSYRVRATAGAISNFTYSNIVTVTPQALSAPANLIATPGNAKISLTWNAVAGATSYQVWWLNSSNIWNQVATAFTTSYTLTGLTNGTRYYYRVNAKDSAGVASTNYAYVDAAPQHLPAPANFVATAGNTKIQLSWSAVPGATSYNVWRKTGASPYAVLLAVSSTSYLNTGLTNGVQYSYAINAVENDGIASPNYSYADATPQIPPAPANFVAVGGNTQVQLSWNAAAEAVNYNVWRKSGTGNYVVVAVVGQLNYLDTSPTNGTTYDYALNAINSAGTSSPNFSYVSAVPRQPNAAPVANNDSYSTNEDTSLTIVAAGVLANDTDANGDALSSVRVSNPTKGTVTLNANGSFTYTPSSNANGADSFTYKASDGLTQSNTATVSITITPVNDAPDAINDTTSTPEGAAKDINVLANDTDVENNALTITSVTQGIKGIVLINTNGTVRYTPQIGATGSDSFSYTISDGNSGTDSATVTLNFTPGSNLVDRTLETGGIVTARGENGVGEGKEKAFDNDLNTKWLDWSSPSWIQYQFANNASQVITRYTLTSANDAPERDPKNWTLKASNDGVTFVTLDTRNNEEFASRVLTKTYDFTNATAYKMYRLDITSNGAGITQVSEIRLWGPAAATPPANTAPVAAGQNVTTNEDTAKSITLSATDDQGNTLTYSVVAQPTKGVLSGTAPNLTYTPNANISGSDILTFKANDGALDSNIATVNITVIAVNDAPVSSNQSTSTNKSTAKSGTLAATDIDSATLTYSKVTDPSHGTVTVASNGAFTYTPTTNYVGSDSFSFKANDGALDSNVATVSVTITNSAPVANAQSVTTNEDTAKTITLSATDVDGDTLSYSITTPPTKGILSGTAPNLTYTPNLNANGSDSFAFKANDGTVDSNVAAVSITITAVNDAPVANSQSISTNKNTAKSGTLSATDVDSTTLTYIKVNDPSNGTVTISSSGAFTYTPTANYVGTDNFTFKANDGALDSNTVTITVTINNTNTAPVANNQSVTTNEDISKSIVLSATDADGNNLIYSIVVQPTRGTLTGTAPNLTYLPNVNFNGSDSFTFKANDGTIDSNTATVSITISPINDAPDAIDDTTSTRVDTAKDISVLTNDTDIDGNTLTVTAVTQGNKGSTSVNANGTVRYTPQGGATGSDSFTYIISDGNGGSDSAIVTITINTLPVGAPTVTMGGTVWVCAGGVDNSAHTATLQISATSNGAPSAGEILTLSFENNTSHDPTRKAKLQLPNGTWQETLTVTLDANGQATVRVLSSDIVSQKDLVVQWSGQEVARKTCNFVAMISKRGFADPFGHIDPNWSANDTGWSSDASAIVHSGDLTSVSIYLKFADSLGNLRPVSGHNLRIRVESVTLWNDMVITGADVANYVGFMNNNAVVSSIIASTDSNGMAQAQIKGAEKAVDIKALEFSAINLTQWSS